MGFPDSHSFEIIRELIKATPASESKRKLAVCITVKAVLYQIQSLHIGLAMKAILKSFIGNETGFNSITVASGRCTRKDFDFV